MSCTCCVRPGVPDYAACQCACHPTQPTWREFDDALLRVVGEIADINLLAAGRVLRIPGVREVLAERLRERVVATAIKRRAQ